MNRENKIKSTVNDLDTVEIKSMTSRHMYMAWWPW